MMSGATGSFRPGKQTCLNQTGVLQYFALYAVKTCPHVGFTQVASAERKRFHRCWWPIWKHLRHVNLLEFTQAGTFADLKAADGCFRKYTPELAHVALVSALVRYSQIICFCGCWIYIFFFLHINFATISPPTSASRYMNFSEIVEMPVFTAKRYNCQAQTCSAHIKTYFWGGFQGAPAKQGLYFSFRFMCRVTHKIIWDYLSHKLSVGTRGGRPWDMFESTDGSPFFSISGHC